MKRIRVRDRHASNFRKQEPTSNPEESQWRAKRQSDLHIQRQLQRLEALRKIDLAINASFDLRLSLEVLVEQVIQQLSVDAAGVLVYDPTAKTYNGIVGRGFRSYNYRDKYFRVGEGLAGQAILKRQRVNYYPLERLIAEKKISFSLAAEQFVAYYGVPLIAKGDILGVLEVFHRSIVQPDQEWLDFLDALAGQATIAVDNQRMFYHMQKMNMDLSQAYDATLEGWSKALESMDREPEGHARRVVGLTMLLAQSMRINDAEIEHIRRGAYLHDIGKMNTPEKILFKPAPLDEKEWEVVRHHPVDAYEILQPIDFLKPALDIPHYHHERWDGTGYPNGLKGEEIPIAARIFAVVDVYDVLLSDRPYRPAWKPKEAATYIQQNSGREFDPNVARLFLDIIQ